MNKSLTQMCTPKLIKIEQVTDDSEADESMPVPSPSPAPNQTVRRDQSKSGGQEAAQEPQPGTSGATETIDLVDDGSESSEEEDEDQPPKEAIDAAREQVTFQLVKEIQ